jgi:hypothetical protein
VTPRPRAGSVVWQRLLRSNDSKRVLGASGARGFGCAAGALPGAFLGGPKRRARRTRAKEKPRALGESARLLEAVGAEHTQH